MDGGWCHSEETLNICFGGRLADDQGIGVNEGQILALLISEAGDDGVHAT